MRILWSSKITIIIEKCYCSICNNEYPAAEGPERYPMGNYCPYCDRELSFYRRQEQEAPFRFELSEEERERREIDYEWRTS